MSSILIPAGLLLIACCFIHRSLRLKNVTLEYRFKFFEFRDKLRICAMNGEISSQAWYFHFLDRSSSKIVGELPATSLFRALFYFLLYRKDPWVIRAQEAIDQASKTNEAFTQLYKEYGDLILAYLKSRHSLVSWLAILVGGVGFSASQGFVRIAKKWAENSALSLRLNPSTAAIGELRLVKST